MTKSPSIATHDFLDWQLKEGAPFTKESAGTVQNKIWETFTVHIVTYDQNEGRKLILKLLSIKKKLGGGGVIDSSISYQCSQNLLFDYDVFFLGFLPKGLLTQNHTKCFTNTKSGFSKQLCGFPSYHWRKLLSVSSRNFSKFLRDMQAFLIISFVSFFLTNMSNVKFVVNAWLTTIQSWLPEGVCIKEGTEFLLKLLM